LTRCFDLKLYGSCSKVKVVGRGSPSHEENAANVVGTTSSEGSLVSATVTVYAVYMPNIRKFQRIEKQKINELT